MASKNISIAILAGGKNSRFGYEEKGKVSLGEIPIVESLLNEAKQCSDDCFIINNNGVYDYLNERVYQDLYLDKGPLAGIYTALVNAKYEDVLVLACDMPFLNKKLFEYLFENHDKDVLTPIYKNRQQPLCSIYNKIILERCRESIEENKLKISMLVDEFTNKEIYLNEKLDFYHDHLLFNMNTKEDLEMIKELG